MIKKVCNKVVAVGSAVVGQVKKHGAKAGLLVGSAGAAMAQTTPDAVETVTGAAATATTAFTAFAGLSATAFVLGMVIAFSRKGKR